MLIFMYNALKLHLVPKLVHSVFSQETNISLDFQRLFIPSSNFSDQWAIATKEQIGGKTLSFWKYVQIVCQVYEIIYFQIWTKI